METNTTSVATSYGQACLNCSRAKCKCLVPRDGGPCERCRRLDKDCRPSQRIRKLKAPKPVAPKTSRLEQKLDGLISMLQSDKTTPSHTTIAASEISGSISSSHYLDHVPLNASHLSPAVSSPDSGLVLTTDQDEQGQLDSFRAGHLSWLPFVHIPISTSAAHLQKESPFLWHCIATTQCKNSTHQTALGTNIKELIARKLLVDCDKSFDLLQGLLVWLAWILHQSQPPKSSLGMFTQLAMALVFDLGLNKAPPKDLDIPISNVNAVGHLPSLRPRMSTTRTMDERRAVLACFLLSSSISHFLGTMEPLRWTPHMSECLTALADSNETPNDIVLAQLIRIQLITDGIFREPWNNNEMGSSETDSVRAPSSFYISAINSRLEDVRNQIPPMIREDARILLYLHHTEISLYETALSRRTPSTAAIHQIDTKRIDDLYSCLTSTQRWLDLWFTIPAAAYVSLPFTLLIQLSHCFVTLFRLTVFKFPGWDNTVVRGAVDILSVADQIADRLHEVAEAAGIQKEDVEGDPFSMLAKMIRALKIGWSSQLSAAGNTTDLTSQNWDQWFTDGFLGDFDESWFRLNMMTDAQMELPQVSFDGLDACMN